jgi:hypothetical protein
MGKKSDGIDSTRGDFAKRKLWKWEWLRRNEEYQKDFKKHWKFLQKGLKEHKDKVMKAIKNNYDCVSLPPPYDSIHGRMYTKWQLLTGLRDPDDPSTENLGIKVYSPDVSVAFTDRLYPELDFEGEESLTSKHRPNCLVIFVRVTPWAQKTKLIKAINQTATKNLGRLLKAQKSVYEKLSLRPRFNEFEKYKKVYDLRHPKKGKGKSWEKIALETLSNEVDIDNAMRKVRYYHDQANWWVKVGWQIL